MVLLTLGAWAPMVVWFVALRPGLMSADSLAVWVQATGGDWVDLHAPLYTASMWVSSELVGDPSLVALGQSLLLAASIVAVARASRRLGAPGWAVVLAAGVVVTSPMVGAFSMSLWKDVPYTAALLFAGARVLDLVQLRLSTDRKPPYGTLRSLGAWLAVAALLRQNGIVFAALLLGLLLFLRPWIRQVAAVAAGVVAVIVISKAALYPLIGVRRVPTYSALSMFLHDVAAVASSEPSAFSADHRSVLGRVAPFDTWRSAYSDFSCSSANWQWRPEFNWAAVEEDPGAFFEVWREVALRRPSRVLGTRLCAGAIAWRPDPGGVVYTVSRGVDANSFGLATEPMVDDLYEAAVDLLDATDASAVQWLVWQAPPWVYSAYLAVSIAAYRRRQAVILVAAAPMVALQGSVLPFVPASDARYMFAAVVFGALLIPVAATRGVQLEAPALRDEGAG